MKQEYSKYTTEDQEVWKFLFNRQTHNLRDKSCKEYLNCLEEMNSVLNENAIPEFDAMESLLYANTGWKLKVVSGLIPVEEFMTLLANKTFCSSTWIRSREKVDYLEEPDMFHDVYGHIPLLMDPAYSNFAEGFGKLGLKYIDFPDIVAQLQSFYWFTIEFGMLRTTDKPLVYGAGIISSYAETKHVLQKEADVREFNFQQILAHKFNNSEIQPCYYAVSELNKIYELIPLLDTYFEVQIDIKKETNDFIGKV